MKNQKIQKTIILILSIFLIAPLFSACKTNEGKDPDINESTDMKKLSRLANSRGRIKMNEWNGNVYILINTYEDPELTETDNKLYMLSTEDYLDYLDYVGYENSFYLHPYFMTHFESKNPVVIAENVELFFPTDDYVFFTKNWRGERGVYRVKNDGTEERTLFNNLHGDEDCYEVVVDGDTVFFTISSVLWSMDQNGQNARELYRGRMLSNIFPDGDYIYFYNSPEIFNVSEISKLLLGTINRYSLLDGSVQQVGDVDDVYAFTVVGDKIYYIGDHFYRMDINGENHVEILPDAKLDSKTICFYKDSILFGASKSWTDIHTYALDLSTQEVRPIINKTFSDAWVIGNKLHSIQGVFDLDELFDT